MNNVKKQVKVENNISEDFFIENEYQEPFQSEYNKLTKLQDWCFSNISDWHNSKKTVFIDSRTASGKTLAVSGSIFNHTSSHNDANHRALFFYPFRALNQDQKGQLQEYGELFGYLKDDFGVYIGGKDKEEIRKIQKENKFLLATPDKALSLFYGGREGRAIFTNLLNSYQFVIFDEIHTYSGLMLWSMIYFLKFWKEIAERSESVDLPTLFFVSATMREEIKEFLEGKVKQLGYETVNTPDEYKKSLSGDWNITLRGTHMGEKEVQNIISSGSVTISNTAKKAYEISKELKKKEEVNELLYIGQDKFKESKRKENLKLFKENPNDYTFLTSPAAEAGVDFTTDNLITEETTSSSMIQRVGRAGRRSGKDSSEEANITIYSPKLTDHFIEEDIDILSRGGFERTVGEVLPKEDLHTNSKFYGIAGFPFYHALEGSRLPVDGKQIIEKDHLETIESLNSKDDEITKKARKFFTFRSFVPYGRFTSKDEEGISFDVLCRKDLKLEDGTYGIRVVGSPSPGRHYSSFRPDHQSVTVELKKEWDFYEVKVEDKEIGVILGTFTFHFPQCGGEEVSSDENSVIWFAKSDKDVPKVLNKSFKLKIKGEKFDGGFVKEDFLSSID